MQHYLMAFPKKPLAFNKVSRSVLPYYCMHRIVDFADTYPGFRQHSPHSEEIPPEGMTIRKDENTSQSQCTIA